MELDACQLQVSDDRPVSLCQQFSKWSSWNNAWNNPGGLHRQLPGKGGVFHAAILTFKVLQVSGES